MAGGGGRGSLMILKYIGGTVSSVTGPSSLLQSRSYPFPFLSTNCNVNQLLIIFVQEWANTISGSINGHSRKTSRVVYDRRCAIYFYVVQALVKTVLVQLFDLLFCFNDHLPSVITPGQSNIA